MSERVGLCLVGPGAIACEHMRAHAQRKLTDPISVVGVSEDQTETFATEWGFNRYTSRLEDALADDAVLVVLIATPNELHARQAIQALEAGKDVIVEIPLAMSSNDAHEVASRAAETRRRVFVCHTQRSWPAVQRLRELVRAGELNISQITSFHSNPRRQNQSWVGGTRDWVDNLLWHGSCHYLDTAMWILGTPEISAVSAHFGRANREFGMTMDISVSFKTAEAQLVTHTATYNVAERVEPRMLLIADETSYVLERSRLVDEHGAELFPTVRQTDLLTQDTSIIESIRTGATSDFDVESVLPVMEVLARAQTAGLVE